MENKVTNWILGLTFYNGICSSANSWQTRAQCERVPSTVSLWDVHILHRDTLDAHTTCSICTYLPRQGTAPGYLGTLVHIQGTLVHQGTHPGTCSHPYVFVRREMHVLTQSLYMCKLLIARIQTLKIKLVLDAPLLFFIKKDILNPFFCLLQFYCN